MAEDVTDATVDLWFVEPAEVHRSSLLERCEALLTTEERARRDAFVFERHRHEYLVTRALARAALASYLGTAPASLAFVRNDHGRPELSPRSLFFNLSNTPTLVVCIVSRDREVGVDIEPIDRGERILGLASTVFTERERGSLARLSSAERERRAVELWTAKESYIKARGMGMSLPVDKIEVGFEADGISISLHPPLCDPRRWSLETRELERHVLATCVDGGGAIRVRRADLGELLA